MNKIFHVVRKLFMKPTGLRIFLMRGRDIFVVYCVTQRVHGAMSKSDS